MILAARQEVARAVDVGLVILYWHIGQRVRRDILQLKRAEYGERIVSALGRQLSAEFGRGFDEKSLRHMLRFAEAFDDEAIVSALRRQLTWTHFKALTYVEDDLKRDFYAEMCRVERWNTRTLSEKIRSMLFERTALSKRPDKLARLEIKKLREQDKLSPDLVFRDPYVLDLLGLKDTYAEKDLEAAIIREIESFILELGVGFTFVARQMRIVIDGEDYHLDLLFYHRKLQRLIALDLKIGEFVAADKGQMELYLRWLAKYDREPHEGQPLGIILCAGKREEHVELLEPYQSGIHVASYLTQLLPKAQLKRKLHETVQLARIRLQERRRQSALESR
ncbi:MAG: PDDEXK nuclease domain-containing protein [Verrucomicrobiales bacterium]|nr:PDDEXK nuclease domain-containing protein [Verrucomicrobiales bacterium]